MQLVGIKYIPYDYCAEYVQLPAASHSAVPFIGIIRQCEKR